MLWIWECFHGGIIACFSKMAKHAFGAFLALSGMHCGEGAAFILVTLTNVSQQQSQWPVRIWAPNSTHYEQLLWSSEPFAF